MNKLQFAFGGFTVAALFLASAALAATDDTKPSSTKAEANEAKDADSTTPPAEKNAERKASHDETSPPAKKVRKLSPEMTERRDHVRTLLKALRTQPFDTQQNTCTDILDFCRAFGCEAELNDSTSTGKKINGITCLCWNMPCNGYQLMTTSEGHLAAKVGYGYQSCPSDLAAVLALSHVPPNYPARADEVRTVADLIEYEKLSCRPGTDMSLKLVALSYYVQGPSWKDSLGKEWTLQRVVSEEMNRPHSPDPHSATNRLLGLVCAIERFKNDKTPLEGDVKRAEQYIDESVNYAFAAQNSDGSWGRPNNRDFATAVGATARMLEWLVNALPENRLEDPQMTRSIDFLFTTFNTPHYQAYISGMSPREISAAMHAAYALNVYDQRVFVPADQPPAAPVDEKANPKPDEKSAAQPVQAR